MPLSPEELYEVCQKTVRVQWRWVPAQDRTDLVHLSWIICTESEVDNEELAQAVVARVCRTYRYQQARYRERHHSMTDVVLSSLAAPPEESFDE